MGKNGFVDKMLPPLKNADLKFEKLKELFIYM